MREKGQDKSPAPTKTTRGKGEEKKKRRWGTQLHKKGHQRSGGTHVNGGTKKTSEGGTAKTTAGGSPLKRKKSSSLGGA